MLERPSVAVGAKEDMGVEATTIAARTHDLSDHRLAGPNWAHRC